MVLSAGSFIAKEQPLECRKEVSWDDVFLGFAHVEPRFRSRRKKVAMTRLILELTRPYRWIIAIVLAAMLVQTAMSLAAPWPLKIILDNVVVVKHPLPHWMTALLPLGGKNKIHIVEFRVRSI
jgi:ABC-type bacteriocin/lantibiotic exporter with double-glycine peptidase domain